MNKLVGLMTMVDSYREIIQTYHNGIKFVTSAKSLENNLFEEEICDSKIKKSVEEFEADMAQLGLAIKEGNKF